jgi:hypothetical protein
MSDNEFKITTTDEFFSLLGKAYWLETQFENAMQWQAYMNVKNDTYRTALFQISHDSEKHKGILLGLVMHFDAITPETLEEHSGMKEKEFDLKGKWDEEIITELLKNEHLTLDVYTKLHQHTDRVFIQKIWKGDNPELFFIQLEFLINEEKKHINLLTPLAGKLQRIL